MSMVSGLRRGKIKPSNTLTRESLTSIGYPASGSVAASETTARKLSAVDACIEILSNSMAKLPNYVLNTKTMERVTNHPILYLLNTRPNEAMTPTVRKKLLETSRLEGGNGYDWIVRDEKTGRPKELIPIPWRLVSPWMDLGGRVWYTITHPFTGEPMVLPREDICHYKNTTRDGLIGISTLQRASEVIATAKAAQEYEKSYYENGGQPSGVLQTASDLGGVIQDPQNPDAMIGRKDLLRREWERVHAGPKNSHRIAILDFGLEYKPLSISNRDAQFVESKEVSIKDIARFFGVPLYKLQEGKQAFSSNEQNSVEYVVSSLHPTCSGYEEEQTYRLLSVSDLDDGLEIRINMMAELKGDTASRSNWYKTMSEVGAFSVDDIRELEDLSTVPGGAFRRMSLNYVPLEYWPELSLKRNGGSEE